LPDFFKTTVIFALRCRK